MPCRDSDLYAFLTDMRNFREFLPEEMADNWQATAGEGSFRSDRTGTVKVSLHEAMPHTMISYKAESFIAGRAEIKIMIEFINDVRSAIQIDTGLLMNPFLRMMAGDAIDDYLGTLMDMIESYDGFDKIRGYNQSP